MAANNMLIARRYAQAALELASDANNVRQWQADLATLARIWRETPITLALTDPKLGRSRRMDEARRLLEGQINPLALNLVLLLIDRGRAGLVPDVASAFERLLRAREGRVQAIVTSAIPLTDPQRANLREQLGRRSGGSVELVERVDPAIMGGLVIRVGDQLIDASVAGRLRRLEAELTGG